MDAPRTGDQEQCARAVVAVYAQVLGLDFGPLVVADSVHDRPRPDYTAETASGEPLAIEHTRGFLIEQQPAVEAQWAHAIAPLTNGVCPDGHVHALVRLRGRKLPRSLPDDVSAWIADELPSLPLGVSTTRLAQTGLEVRSERLDSDRRRLIIRPSWSPVGGWTPEAEAHRIAAAIQEGTRKFTAAPDHRTALVFHSDDFTNASGNHFMQMLAAAIDAAGEPEMDEVWLARTLPSPSDTVSVCAMWSRRPDAIGRVWAARWSPATGIGELRPWAPGLPWGPGAAWRKGSSSTYAGPGSPS